jgi:hypothetical protein
LAISSAVRDIVDGRRLQQRQRERTWPAMDRGGVFSSAETSRCGTTSEDGAGDIFGLLTRWRRLARGGSNVMISSHDGGLRLVAAPGGRASVRASSTAILDTSPEREPCGGFGGPRARERRAEWRVGGPRARKSGWLRFRWSSRRRWSVWLQQLGGIGSRMAAVLSVQCCLPLGFSIGGGFR